MSFEEHAGPDEESERLEVEVPTLMDQMRVDRALAMLTGCSRAEAVALVEAGSVVVDGKMVTKASLTLGEGSLLEATLPPVRSDAVEPESGIDFEIIFEDPELLIVNKPASLVVHPGAGHRKGTLVAGLLARFPEISSLPEGGWGEVTRPGIVHRLDKGTSGLLAVARTPAAFESLTEQFATHQAQRRYVGIVEGAVENAQGVIDAPIGRSATTPTKMAVRPDGKDARTRYVLLGRLQRPDRSVVGLSLETGRTHQIRVHMAAIGHAIVNDPRYGQRNERRLDAERLALHAGRLELRHPGDGSVLRAVAPMPADLEILGASVEADAWLSGS